MLRPKAHAVFILYQKPDFSASQTAYICAHKSYTLVRNNKARPESESKPFFRQSTPPGVQALPHPKHAAQRRKKYRVDIYPALCYACAKIETNLIVCVDILLFYVIIKM